MIVTVPFAVRTLAELKQRMAVMYQRRAYAAVQAHFVAQLQGRPSPPQPGDPRLEFVAPVESQNTGRARVTYQNPGYGLDHVTIEFDYWLS